MTMLSLVDRLSNSCHAEFMFETQVWQTGGRVTAAIRPVRAADLAALGDFFTGLSMQTRYLRFFAPVTPGPDLLRLMSGGDGRTDAVVAVRGGVIIGHAMAVDQAEPQGTRTTDIGVVVADAWQGLGIGSALVRALVTGAQARGVTTMTMDVLPGNQRMLAMIRSRWPAASGGRSDDHLSFCIRLPHRQQRSPLAPPAPFAYAG
jgi:ribosomal protein S18 acetylase RimI-like enzyme